jgi:hypothetical protein
VRLLSASERRSHAPNISDASWDSCGCGANVYPEVTHMPSRRFPAPQGQSHNELGDKQLEE